MNDDRSNRMNAESRTTVVVGASRGLGRAIAAAFADAGDNVVAIARNHPRPDEALHRGNGPHRITADASQDGVAERIIGEFDPDLVVLVAGASPVMAPLRDQTWESFSANWHTDVRIAFSWVRATLSAPLRPGSQVVVISSGAALAGSPLSGGYAGAKATQRFIATYAQGESDRAGLGISYVTVLPRPAPATEIGRAAINAYATMRGIPTDVYLAELGGVLTPEDAGTALVKLASAQHPQLGTSFLLSGAGLQSLP
jgi:NAD(P)-dependent dehydrogenase (short-subunit alcohol dehydrogenase family)